MGERLKKARIEAGIESASAAAKKFGGSVSTYLAHENGQNDYSPERAEIYASKLKVRAEWLLFGNGAKAANDPGIDAQLRRLDPEDSRKLIDRFNAMLEGVRVLGKIR